MGRIIAITGTDTGVGKTALTALLLAHAQNRSIHVRALKPFSAGGHSDENLLGTLQDRSLTINLHHFPEAISPWAAARARQITVDPEKVLGWINEHARACDLLLIEGAGGLLAPLADGFNMADMIARLQADSILVAANRLGVLNHTLLCAEVLRHRQLPRFKLVLMEHPGADISRKSNLANLTELLEPNLVVNIPVLQNYRVEADFIRAHAKLIEEPLDQLIAGKKNPPDTEAGGTSP